MKRLLPHAVFAVLSASMVRAAIPCPFLNQATAAGILGGEVVVSVSITDKDKNDASCQFTQGVGHAASVLRIEVNTMKSRRTQFPPFLAQCGPHATILRGIGNEAISCGGTAEDGTRFVAVRSRVRERSLLVRVATGNMQRSAALLLDQATQAADEVSGNLF